MIHIHQMSKQFWSEYSCIRIQNISYYQCYFFEISEITKKCIIYNALPASDLTYCMNSDILSCISLFISCEHDPLILTLFISFAEELSASHLLMLFLGISYITVYWSWTTNSPTLSGVLIADIQTGMHIRKVLWIIMGIQRCLWRWKVKGLLT